MSKEWIPAIGWFVIPTLTFLFGMLIQQHIAKKKIIAWSVISENDLFPEELSDTLGTSVRLLVDGTEQASLSAVTLRIGGGGNETIENFTLEVLFDAGCSILNVRPIKDLGAYAKYVKWDLQGHKCVIEFAHMNPKKTVDLEFLLSKHLPGSTKVDGAAAGLTIIGRKLYEWDVPTSFFGNLAISLPFTGVRYDPTITSMREIAQELREVRQAIRTFNIAPIPIVVGQAAEVDTVAITNGTTSIAVSLPLQNENPNPTSPKSLTYPLQDTKAVIVSSNSADYSSDANNASDS